MDRLQQILEVKQGEIERLTPRSAELRATALLRNDFRPFATAIDRDPLGLIAEVKKASPSAGVISEEFDPVQIARAYESAGAHAISVLTDEQFFQGHLSYLTEIRKAVALPLLRKDFILHEVQIYEAACAGADAILLIMAALDKSQFNHLFQIATACQLEVLVEIRTMRELDRALDANARVIGINNRDLTTMVVDLETTQLLAEQVPDELVLVSESGIKTPADARQVSDWGVNAILVGEALMRAGDIHAAVQELTVFPE